MELGAVLMASGFARRFGTDKLLQPVEGVPMIERAFAAVPAGLFRQAVVVSRDPKLLRLAERSGYSPVPNPRAAEGQSASIRLGLSRLGDLDGVLFAVCDQPWLRRRSVERLLADFSAHPDHICALGWKGQRGSPVMFPAARFPELLALTGDWGGGRVIQAHPDLLRVVEAEDPRELRDVDRPEDLAEP